MPSLKTEMDFRNQVGIDIFGSEIGSDLENRGPAAQHPYQRFPGVPRGWWLAKLDCDLFFTLPLYSLEEFIVDDDDEDLEEEVFEDPGYQEEFDFVSDKENDDCIEIATPGRLPFLKRTKSVERIANLVLDLLTKFLDSPTFLVKWWT